MAASRPPKRNRQLMTIGALAVVTAAVGAVIGFRSVPASVSPVPAAAAVHDVPAPLVAPAAVQAPTTEPSPRASVAVVGEGENEALVIDASSSKRSAKRAPRARPARPAPAVTSAAPPTPKRRATIDDSEPDVGY